MNKMPDFPLQNWWRDGITPRDAVEIIKDELGDHNDSLEEELIDYV